MYSYYEQKYFEDDTTHIRENELFEQIWNGDNIVQCYPQELIENALRTVLCSIIDNQDDETKENLFCFNSSPLYPYVNESLLREFKDYINWNVAVTHFKFSEDFIKYDIPYKNWKRISQYQILSEKFIEEFKDEVDWDQICRYQQMSFDFIKKHKKEVNWSIVQEHQESWFKHINNIN